MSDTNTYLTQEAAVLQNPIAFTAGVANIQANLQRVIDAVTKEGTDATDHRLFLDEMSPAARLSIFKILTALKATSV